MKQLVVSLGRVAAVSAVMMWLAAPAGATVVGGVFTTKVPWTTSLTPVTTVDFNEALSGPYAGLGAQLYSTAGGYTSPQSAIVNFLGQDSGYSLKRLKVGSETWLVGPAWTSGGAGDPRVIINFSAAATAFGIDISSSIPGISYEIRIVQGTGTETFNVNSTPQAPNTPAFFGVHTDSNITSVQIRMSGGQVVAEESRFDNVSYADFVSTPPDPGPSETPEVSTLVSGAMGLVLLAWARQRRQGLHQA